MDKLAEELKGKMVIVRSYAAGVYFGTLEGKEGSEVKLANARNIWHWTGANCLADIADHGVTGDKISRTIDSLILTDVCQIMPLTVKAIENLNSQPTWTR